MFSEEVFVADCMEFLCAGSYEDYEDVKYDISLFVEDNLPSELKSLELKRSLCCQILEEYIKCDEENSLLETATVDGDCDDDTLSLSVEIWLEAAAAAANSD
jgi:hypothetical protein